jgi:hypothetical protein
MVYSDIVDTHLRYALRVYFIAGMFVLAIIGNQCCKCAARLDLLKGRQVDLHRMTGWLHPKETIYCIWKLKRLPGGLWLGLMMIVASIVTIAGKFLSRESFSEDLLDTQSFFVAEQRLTVNVAADFATNSIREVPTMGRCKFETGLVTRLDWSKLSWTSPPVNGMAAVRASNGQSASFQNGCQIGVYKKIPGFEDPLFCAGDDDIYGTWSCNDLNRDHVFGPEVNESSIEDWMVDNGLHFRDWADIQYNDEQTLNNNSEVISMSHLVLWSIYQDNDTVPANSNDYAYPITHVRISIDLNATDSDPKTMKTFECNVTSSNNQYREDINTIVGIMNASETLTSWSGGLDAKVYAYVQNQSHLKLLVQMRC